MKKVCVITGATGLLGRSVVELLANTWDLHLIVRRCPNIPRADVTYHALDFSTSWQTERLPGKTDAIIHLAQSSLFRDFPCSALDVFRVNIESTAKLLDYAKKTGAERFIYASSGGIYVKGGVAYTENSPIAPPGQLGYYLGSKLCSEVLAQSYASLMHILVLRPFFIYGSGQNRTMLIPRLMDNVAAGRPVSLQGVAGIRVNPIHVADASGAVLACMTVDQSSTFNIAGPEILSIREICEGMGSYLGRDPIFQIQPGDPQDLIGNNAAMCEQLITPERRLLQSLAELKAL